MEVTENNPESSTIINAHMAHIGNKKKKVVFGFNSIITLSFLGTNQLSSLNIKFAKTIDQREIYYFKISCLNLILKPVGVSFEIFEVS